MKKLKVWSAVLALLITGPNVFAQQDIEPETAGFTDTETSEIVKSDAAEALLDQSEPLSTADWISRDTYRIDTIVCPFKGDISYEPGEIECGLLEVPENREDPQSRFIELHFVKLNSRWGREGADEENDKKGDRDEKADRHAEGLADGKRQDPVVYLTGGPGAAVTSYVTRFKDHTLLDHRDLYILEQRGIGWSDNFCFFYGGRNPSLSNVDNFEDQLAANNQIDRDCARNAMAGGADLSGYNTIENARDVKALRRALGFENWNVWGISYGSILGQAYLKEDPEGIRAAIIDAIMPLAIANSDEYWRVANWYVRDLQKLQDICDRQPDCAKTYPDMLGRIRAAISSVIDNPIEVEVKDTELFPSGKAWVFQDIVGMLPFMLFYEQANYAGLPGVIYAWADAVERRDPDLFMTLANAMGDTEYGQGGPGMRNAILCIDGDRGAMERAGRLDIAEFPLIGGAFQSADSLAEANILCDEAGMNTRPQSEFQPTLTDIPTLIVEGEMDPITPPPNAKAILPGFSNGTYVEFPFAGHGPTRSVTCAGHMMNKFYDDPQAKPDLGCVDDMEEPQIWAPMYTPSIGAKLGATYFRDKLKLVGPVAWGGLSLLVLITAFLVLSFAPIFRLFDRRNAPLAGNARWLTWLASASAISAVVIIAAAALATYETSTPLLAFGMVPWAVYGAWLGVLSGVLGLLALAATISAWRKLHLPFSSVLGLGITALAAVGLSSFMLLWGLGPI